MDPKTLAALNEYFRGLAVNQASSPKGIGRAPYHPDPTVITAPEPGFGKGAGKDVYSEVGPSMGQMQGSAKGGGGIWESQSWAPPSATAKGGPGPYLQAKPAASPLLSAMMR